MESPLKSWCYNCNAYHNPDIQYRLTPTPKGRGQNKSGLTLEYRAICPLCHRKMIPDKRIRAIVNMAKDRLLGENAEKS